MRVTGRTGDRAGRADAGTCGAALALLGIDLVVEQRLAVARRTALLVNVRLVLMTEVAQRGQYGVGGRLTQAAQSGVLYVVGEGFQTLYIAVLALLLPDYPTRMSISATMCLSSSCSHPTCYLQDRDEIADNVIIAQLQNRYVIIATVSLIPSQCHPA